MPRVGFFQSVLRQPTRSYANPHAASPWALDDEDDNASGSSRGYAFSDGGRGGSSGANQANGGSRYGRQEDYRGNGYNQAGPSRQSGRYRPPPQAFASVRQPERYEQDHLEGERAQSVRSRTMSDVGTRKPRKAKSTPGVSAAAVHEEEEYPQAALTEERLATRFPRATPKSRSVVGIQDTGRGVSVIERPSTSMSSAPHGEGTGTVRKKKKRPAVVPGGEGGYGGQGQERMSEAARMAADTRARTVSGPSSYTVTTLKSTRPKSTPSAATKCPPPIQAKPSVPRSSAQSGGGPPAPAVIVPTRTTQLLQQPSMTRETHHAAPPSVSSSSAQSSRDRVPQTPPDPPVQVIPVLPVVPVMEVAELGEAIHPKSNDLRRSDSTRTTRSTRSRMSVASDKTGDTVYWTPPTSPGSNKEAAYDSSDEDELKDEEGRSKVPAISDQIRGKVEQQEDIHEPEDPETPAADEQGPPRLTIQPPTPAPLPDTAESVFNTPVLPSPSPKTAAPQSQALAGTPATGVPKRALSITRPKLATTGSAPPVLSPSHDDDVQSLHAHTGSDDDEGAHAPTPLDAEPMSAHQLSRPPARPPSITHSAPLPPRQDRRHSRSPGASRSHSRQNSRAGSTVGSAARPPTSSYAASDVSAGALAAGVNRALAPRRPSREGSVRSSSSYTAAAGFGKGGWAAAAASGSQSGRNSPNPQPTMYMPTGTMDGWEQFHVPAPQRQSKYTPLPAASQPATFERLLRADDNLAGLGSGSRGGSVRSGGSSPKEVSADGREARRNGSPLGARDELSSSAMDGDDVGRSRQGEAGQLDVPTHQYPSRSESSHSQYSDEQEGSSSSEEEDEGERPSRSYTVVENPSRLPRPPSPVGRSDVDTRRTSADGSAPPIPAKSPRRFSATEDRQQLPVPSASRQGREIDTVNSYSASESQYSYGSESAIDSPPDAPSSGRLPDTAQLASPVSYAYTGSNGHEVQVMDRHDAESVGEAFDEREAGSEEEYSDEYEGEDPDDIPARPLSPTGSIGSTRFPRPSFLDPDVLTVLPEMSLEDSNNLYRSPTISESRQSWKGQNGATSASGAAVNGHNPYEDSSRPGSRAASRAGSIRRSPSEMGEGDYGSKNRADEEGDAVSTKAKSEKRPISILRPAGKDKASSHGGSELGAPQSNGNGTGAGVKKAKSSIGFSLGGKKEEKKSVHWEGSSMGEGVLMLSDGKEERVGNGYTSLILPAGAYTPTDPSRKRSSLIDHRVLGMPSTVMAALTLSGSASKLHQTPAHLRHNLPPPVDFSSHLPPPNKVGSAQVLVQVYAVGVDKVDLRLLEEKGKGEVGKWVPGRSFVGRVMATGKDEKEVVKGELVVGLLDVRKSGALAEYILIDRRRVTRAPHPTSCTLEQLSLLPLHGLPAVRTIRSLCLAPRMQGERALIQDAHQGIPALLCQELSRRGVHVTAIIPGGENAHEAQTKCMAHGARGVLTGSPAAVMFGLEEGGWDYVVDTTGGERVYDACKRVLRENGKLISLVKATPKLPAAAQAASKPSGFRTLRAAFAPKATRRDSKHIHFEYVAPAGDGEPEVDARGMDVRDVLEDDLMAMLRPAWEGDRVWNFERGWEAFKADKGLGVSVVRLIN